MSGVFDFLFGEEGEPAQVVDVTPPEFTKLRPDIRDALRDLISTGGGAPFTGQTTAQIGSAEQQLLELIQAQSTGQTGAVASAEDLVTRTLGGEFLGGNPFLDELLGTLEASSRRQFAESFPALQAPFQRVGQQVTPGSSSPFDRAAGSAKSALLDRLATTEAQLRFGSFEAERGRQAAAVGQAQGLARDDFERAVRGLQAAALPRLVEQFGLDTGLAEFRRRTDVLLKAIAQAGQLASGGALVVPGTESTTGLVQEALVAFAGS